VFSTLPGRYNWGMSYTAVVKVRTPAERALELVQREFPDYHPLTALARMAHKQAVLDDPKIELAVHSAILPYVAPKLAVHEVKAMDETDRRVVVTLFEDAKPIGNGGSSPVEIPLVRDVEEVVPLD
jgi:CRISPR/Cas system-associated exonuclease Cas4 (RecB family)